MRADVTTEHLLLLLAALGRTLPALTSVVPNVWQRYLAMLLDGLHVQATGDLPAPSLTPAQLDQVLHDLGPQTVNGPR
jgi:hypothetical protein